MDFSSCCWWCTPTVPDRPLDYVIASCHVITCLPFSSYTHPSQLEHAFKPSHHHTLEVQLSSNAQREGLAQCIVVRHKGPRVSTTCDRLQHWRLNLQGGGEVKGVWQWCCLSTALLRALKPQLCNVNQCLYMFLHILNSRQCAVNTGTQPD
jgi:hypothetical protein